MSETEGTAMETMRQFVERVGITTDVKWASSNPNMADRDWQANHYSVTLRHGRKRLTVPFSMGIGLTEEPTAADVLNSLAMDASGWENSSQDFESWCDEYGYDTDSRSAERTFRTVGQQARKLATFLGDEYERLLWQVESL